MAWTRSGSPRGSYRAAFATFRNDRRTLLLLLLFLLTTPAFAITIQSLDIDNVDDTDIESDLDVRVTKEGSQPVTHRIRPARLFVMYNGGFGMGDEVQAALAKIVVTGAQQTLARLNREHFQAPALPAIETRLAALKKLDDRGQAELHAIAEEHVPLLVRRFATEDDDVHYATIIALASAGTPQAMALIREKGMKDRTTIVRKLSERLLGER